MSKHHHEYVVEWRPGGVLATDDWKLVNHWFFASRKEAEKDLAARRRGELGHYMDFRVVRRRVTAWKPIKG